MKNFNPEDYEDAWTFFITEQPYLDMSIQEIFRAGYRSACHDHDEDWEDGYAHGYDSGRYKSIEEGF